MSCFFFFVFCFVLFFSICFGNLSSYIVFNIYLLLYCYLGNFWKWLLCAYMCIYVCPHVHESCRGVWEWKGFALYLIWCKCWYNYIFFYVVVLMSDIVKSACFKNSVTLNLVTFLFSKHAALHWAFWHAFVDRSLICLKLCKLSINCLTFKNCLHFCRKRLL